MIKISSIKNGSGGNSYVVQNEETQFLLECGIPYKKIVLEAYRITGKKLSNFTGCLITHKHGDHSKSAKEIEKRMKIYTNKSTIEKNHLRNYYEIKELTPFSIGTIKLLPISVKHGETPNFAYILKDKDSLKFFGTDFNLCEYNLSKYAFEEIWIECNYVNERISLEEKDEYKFERQINTHMSINGLVEHLKKMNLTNCKKINLIHLSKFYSDKQIIRKKLSEFNIEVAFAKGGY